MTITGCIGSFRDPDFPQESRVRENLTHGLMRVVWKPGMVAGTEALPERTRGLSTRNL
jgi:hypothetical protein